MAELFKCAVVPCASLGPMPLSMCWTFLAFGTIALLVVCFQVWRTEYRGRLNEKARLKLLRMIDNGERLIASLEHSTATQQIFGIQDGVVGLNQWRRECKQILQTEYASVWEHFADLPEVEASKIEQGARLLISRMKMLCAASVLQKDARETT